MIKPIRDMLGTVRIARFVSMCLDKMRQAQSPGCDAIGLLCRGCGTQDYTHCTATSVQYTSGTRRNFNYFDRYIPSIYFAFICLLKEVIFT